MNKFIKYAIVGMAGYLVGHFEMKYKLVRWALDTKIKQEKESKDGDEAQ